jgi:hypothetical protein
VVAEFRHPHLGSPNTRPVAAGATAERVSVRLPNDAAAATAWPAGNYTVALRITRAGRTVPTNGLHLALAPRLSAVPRITGSAASPQLTLSFSPSLVPGQRVDVFVADEPFVADPITATTSTLTLSVKGVRPSELPAPVRVRVDGVESLLVREPGAQPPQFDPKQMVVLPS